MKYILIIFLLGNIAYAQCQFGFYKIVDRHLEHTDYYTEALKWWSYFNIETTEDWSATPAYLSNASTRFGDAIDTWKAWVNSEIYSLIIIRNTQNGVQIFFSDDTDYFTDPGGNEAMTTSCAANDELVSYCDEFSAQLDDPVLPTHPVVTNARIVFNTTTDFPTDILSDSYCSQVPVDKTSFTRLVMHELGHIFGLDHCGINGDSIMAEQIKPGPVCGILSTDKIWLLNLIWGNPGSSSKILRVRVNQ